MDWLNDFQAKFSNKDKYPEIQDIKSLKKHCAIEINFCEGIPQNYNYKLHRKSESLTLTKGDK